MVEASAVVEVQERGVDSKSRTVVFEDLEFKHVQTGQVLYVVKGMIVKLVAGGSAGLMTIAFQNSSVGFYGVVTSFAPIWVFDVFQEMNGKEYLLKTVSFSGFEFGCGSRSYTLDSAIENYIVTDATLLKLRQMKCGFKKC